MDDRKSQATPEKQKAAPRRRSFFAVDRV